MQTAFRNTPSTLSTESLQLIDTKDTSRSVSHGEVISKQEFIELFGEPVYKEFSKRACEGEGEALIIKGGQVSQIINFPWLRRDLIRNKELLGDLDILVTGKKTVGALLSEHPDRGGKNRITTHILSDKQEIEYVNGEKIKAEIKEVVIDAIAQAERVQASSGGKLTPQQDRAYTQASYIQDELKRDPEHVLLGKGLERSKEVGIKVEKINGELQFHVCDPSGSIHDNDVWERDRWLDHMHTGFFGLDYGTEVALPRSIPNISPVSTQRLVMDMVVAFGHIETSSPFVLSTVPLAMNVITNDIVTGMVFAGDGLAGLETADGEAVPCKINRALDSIALMKEFIASIVEDPEFADILPEVVNELEAISSLGKYNMQIMHKKLIESMNSGIETTMYYMFSYFPSLAGVIVPTIDSLPALSMYHEVFDGIDQNFLYVYVDGFDDEASPFVAQHQNETAFFRNIGAICNQIYPEGWIRAIDGSDAMLEPLVYKQIEPTGSMERVLAVVLLAAGVQNPSVELLDKVVNDWNKYGGDELVTSEEISTQLNWLIEKKKILLSD